MQGLPGVSRAGRGPAVADTARQCPAGQRAHAAAADSSKSSPAAPGTAAAGAAALRTAPTVEHLAVHAAGGATNLALVTYAQAGAHISNAGASSG